MDWSSSRRATGRRDSAVQLSQFTDYALRSLMLVALNGDRRTTID